MATLSIPANKLFLEHGQIVAEYVREDIDPLEPWDAWSVTKSWTSLLIGHIIENDIWPDDEAIQNETWSQVSENVTNVEFRKNTIAIQALLTMASGLVSDTDNEGTAISSTHYPCPQCLESPANSRTWASLIFLPTSFWNELDCCRGKYAKQTLFPVLGINDDDTDIKWWKNTDGIETAYHGLFLTSRQMAKFGQLYLQRGVVGPSA